MKKSLNHKGNLSGGANMFYWTGGEVTYHFICYKMSDTCSSKTILILASY